MSFCIQLNIVANDEVHVLQFGFLFIYLTTHIIHFINSYIGIRHVVSKRVLSCSLSEMFTAEQCVSVALKQL